MSYVNDGKAHANEVQAIQAMLTLMQMKQWLLQTKQSFCK
jgi:hypothetical protein